jgi:hypothetical protein
MAACFRLPMRDKKLKHCREIRLDHVAMIPAGNFYLCVLDAEFLHSFDRRP